MPKSKTYEEFTEKFKPKLTTDDCYTPDAIYDAVLDYACKRYGFRRDKIARPFWPGADYRSFDYSGYDAVVDNPPFSIGKQIRKFYRDNGIHYFLFVPGLTAFTREGLDTVISLCFSITYQNGAKVSTSFATDMEPDVFCRTAPDLYDALKQADKKIRKEIKYHQPRYAYPPEVVSSALLKKLHSVPYTLNRSDVVARIPGALDAQKEAGKDVYGGGVFITEKAAAEKAAAEKAAAEKAAAESAIVWELSDREKKLIRDFEAAKKDREASAAARPIDTGAAPVGLLPAT